MLVKKFRLDFTSAYNIDQCVGLSQFSFSVMSVGGQELKTLPGITVTASSQYDYRFPPEAMLDSSSQGWGCTWKQSGWIEFEFRVEQDVSSILFRKNASFCQWDCDSFILPISGSDGDRDRIIPYTNGHVRQETGSEHLILLDEVFDKTVFARQQSQTATNHVELQFVAAVTAAQRAQQSEIATTVIHPPSYAWGVQGSQRAQSHSETHGEYDKFYFATAGLTTTANSTPAHFEIPPTLKNPGNYKNEIDLKNFGIVKPSIGTITISNHDGRHDDLLMRGVDGQNVTLYRGKRGADFPDGFTKMLVSTVSGISATLGEIQIKLRNNLEFLNMPYLRDRFTGMGGAEGDESVKGMLRQRHFKDLPYLPPVLIDAQKLIYLISDHRIFDPYYLHGRHYRDIDQKTKIYEGGVELSWVGATYGSVTEMEQISPLPGQVRLLLNYDGPAYFRLGSPPAFELRVKTIGEILSETCKGDMANIWSTNLNKIKGRTFRFIPDSPFNGTPKFEFNEHNIHSISFTPSLPAKKITFNSGETFPCPTAPAAPAEVQRDLAKQGFMASYVLEKNEVTSKHELAPEVSINSKNYESFKALEWDGVIDRLNSYYDEHVIIGVTVKNIDVASIVGIDIHDVVLLKLGRYGFDAGKDCVIVGVRHDYARNSFSFTLWR